MINIFRLAKFLPFNPFSDPATIGIIGGADGPTSIYVNGANVAPSLIAAAVTLIGVIFVWFMISVLITVLITVHMVNKYKVKKNSGTSCGYVSKNSDNSQNDPGTNSSSEDK